MRRQQEKQLGVAKGEASEIGIKKNARRFALIYNKEEETMKKDVIYQFLGATIICGEECKALQ